VKKLTVNFSEIQKAMEDLSREAFEYFLDTETGHVIILSVDIIKHAYSLLEEIYDEDMAGYDEVEFDEIVEIPDWMEEEIELALHILLFERQRYARIPEREAGNGYAAMKEFTDCLMNPDLKNKLSGILDGRGAFRRFKDALAPYPKERKLWYGFNAKANRKRIAQWLMSLGIEPGLEKE
jgi:hypothetical protein